MARFDEIDQYLNPGLELTVRGKVYTVPLPSAALGLWCRRMAQSAGEVTAATSDEELRAAGERAVARAKNLPTLPGGKDVTFEERMLGDTYAEMIADDVPDPYVLFCAQTAYIWIIGGEVAAERYWTSGGRPEARGPVPNRADRRRAARAGATSTAAADATPSPASTSGTTSRRPSGQRRRGSRSRGRRS